MTLDCEGAKKRVVDKLREWLVEQARRLALSVGGSAAANGGGPGCVPPCGGIGDDRVPRCLRDVWPPERTARCINPSAAAGAAKENAHASEDR
jgi:hypothetical protein